MCCGTVGDQGPGVLRNGRQSGAGVLRNGRRSGAGVLRNGRQSGAGKLAAYSHGANWIAYSVTLNRVKEDLLPRQTDNSKKMVGDPRHLMGHGLFPHHPPANHYEPVVVRRASYIRKDSMTSIRNATQILNLRCEKRLTLLVKNHVYLITSQVGHISNFFE